MAEDSKPEEGVVTPGDRFLETISLLKNGVVLQDVGERLLMLVKCVSETGKAGALTLTFKVAPSSKGNSEIIGVEVDVKERLPRPSLGETIFFVQQDGDAVMLTRNNPKQQLLFQKGN